MQVYTVVSLDWSAPVAAVFEKVVSKETQQRIDFRDQGGSILYMQICL